MTTIGSTKYPVLTTEKPVATQITVLPMQSSMVSAVADLHRTSFNGYLNTRLGKPYLRAFFAWFCEADTAIALCACDDRQLVGYVVGAPVGYAGALNRRLLPPALWGIGLRPWLFLDSHFRQTVAGRWREMRGLATSNDQPDLPTPTVSLVGISVHPKARGRRIGLRLMDAFEQQARSSGARSLRLSVYPENAAARTLYSRVGWQCQPRAGTGRMADFFCKILDEEPVAPCQNVAIPA